MGRHRDEGSRHLRHRTPLPRSHAGAAASSLCARARNGGSRAEGAERCGHQSRRPRGGIQFHWLQGLPLVPHRPRGNLRRAEGPTRLHGRWRLLRPRTCAGRESHQTARQRLFRDSRRSQLQWYDRGPCPQAGLRPGQFRVDRQRRRRRWADGDPGSRSRRRTRDRCCRFRDQG